MFRWQMDELRIGPFPFQALIHILRAQSVTKEVNAIRLILERNYSKLPRYIYIYILSHPTTTTRRL